MFSSTIDSNVRQLKTNSIGRQQKALYSTRHSICGNNFKNNNFAKTILKFSDKCVNAIQIRARLGIYDETKLKQKTRSNCQIIRFSISYPVNCIALPGRFEPSARISEQFCSEFSLLARCMALQQNPEPNQMKYFSKLRFTFKSN